LRKEVFLKGLPGGGSPERAFLEEGLEGAEVERRFRRAVSSMLSGEAEAAFFLVEIDERELWRQLGFSSVVQYACDAANIGMNKAYALLRIGRRLRELHLIRRALIENRIGWTKVREILRLKNLFCEKQVIEKAESCSYSELEEYVTKENAKTARSVKALASNAGNAQLGIFNQPDEPRAAGSKNPSSVSLEKNTAKRNSEPGNQFRRESVASPVSDMPKAGSNGSAASGSLRRSGHPDESAASTEFLSDDPEPIHEEETPAIALPPERTRHYVTVTLKFTPAEYAFLQEAHRLWKHENREDWKREQMLSALSRSYLEEKAVQCNVRGNGKRCPRRVAPGLR